MRPLRLIAAAGALGMAAAPPTMAAWSPPQRVSTGAGDAHSPDVALNGRGDAVAVWVQESGPRGRIVASARRAGGPWSRPAAVSPPGLSAVDPRVAIDPAGRIVAVWRQVVRTRVLLGRKQAVYVARARERRAGGGWGTVATLSDDRQKVGAPELAIDGRGVAIATWHWGTGTRAGSPGHVGQVQIAERRPGRDWSRARPASRAGGCSLDTRLPQVAAGAGGHAVVWWQCDQAGGRSATDAIGRGPTPGAWSARRRLPFAVAGDQVADLAVNPGGTALAVSAAGGALAAWRGAQPVGSAGGLDLAQIALPAPQRVAPDAGRLALAAGPAGAAVAGWIGPGGLGLADIGAAGAVDRISEPVGPARARREVRLAATPGGSAVAVGVSGSGVLATSRRGAGDWSALERISSAGPVDDPAVAATDDLATAYWSRRTGGRVVVERAELETGP